MIKPAGQALIAQFQSEATEIRFAPEPVRARATLFTLAALLVSLVALSLVFDVDRVVETQYGAVITTRPVFVLQALDPSIIKSIDISEGQHVAAGQVLATLDPTFAAADVTALRMQIAGLDAEIARCEAELAGRPYVAKLGADPAANSYALLQQSYYLQRKQGYDAQLKSDNEQIAQAKATLVKTSTDAARYADRADIAGRVLAIRKTLEAHAVGSHLDTLTAADTRLESLRNMQSDQNSLAETAHMLAQLTYTRDAFIQTWLGTTSEELVTARTARDAAIAGLDKAARHSELVRITAPDDAVVLQLEKLSIGSVLKEGDSLGTLASLKSPVEADVTIAARDIGFIRVGDPATVKLDAYQFVEHGTASARVKWISEGTFTADPGSDAGSSALPVAPYYKARLEFTSVNLHGVPEGFRLIPGMTLSADVHVGKRSLFMYMVRGLVRGIDESMREP